MFHLYPPKTGVDYAPVSKGHIKVADAIGDRYSTLVVVGIREKIIGNDGNVTKESQVVWGYRWSSGEFQTQGPYPYKHRRQIGIDSSQWEQPIEKAYLLMCGNGSEEKQSSVIDDLGDDWGLECQEAHVETPDGLGLVEQVEYVLKTWKHRVRTQDDSDD